MLTWAAPQQTLNQQRLPSLTIPAPAASPYSPAAITAALSAQNNQTARTVYVGNLPATASVDELLNLVHFGPLESIRVLPEKSCVFLSFLFIATDFIWRCTERRQIRCACHCARRATRLFLRVCRHATV